MGSRGPLPKPDATRQDRRSSRSLTVLPAAEVPVEAPPAPSGLLRASVTLWERFWASPVASAVDRNADMGRLERWIAAVDEYYRVRRTFRRARLVGGSKGQPVLSPLAAYLATLEATIAAAEAAFGMTPASRARLGLTIGQAKLTAAALNDMLARTDAPSSDDGDWAEGFEP